MKTVRLRVSLALTTLSMLGWCNDSAVVGVGGVIEPMQSHPSVVLRSHVVKIKLTPKRPSSNC
jgi:hypothetical protein